MPLSMILIFEFAFDPMVWHFLVCIVRNLYRFTVCNGLLVDIKTNTIALFEKAARHQDMCTFILVSCVMYNSNTHTNKRFIMMFSPSLLRMMIYLNDSDASVFSPVLWLPNLILLP